PNRVSTLLRSGVSHTNLGQAAGTSSLSPVPGRSLFAAATIATLAALPEQHNPPWERTLQPFCRLMMCIRHDYDTTTEYLYDRYCLINTANLTHSHCITKPYLQSQAVNLLDELILCNSPSHQADVVQQVNDGFELGRIASQSQWRYQTKSQQSGAEQPAPST